MFTYIARLEIKILNRSGYHHLEFWCPKFLLGVPALGYQPCDDDSHYFRYVN